MRYFNLRQDTRIQNHPKINQQISSSIWTDPIAKTFEVDSSSSEIGFCALPLLISSDFFISPEMKRIFEAYQIGSRSQLLSLQANQQAYFYYAYQPPTLDCVHSDSIYYHDHRIKHLVLNQNGIFPHKVFQPAGLLEKYLIVDFDILEVLLAEAIYPFQFQEIEIRTS